MALGEQSGHLLGLDGEVQEAREATGDDGEHGCSQGDARRMLGWHGGNEESFQRRLQML